MVRTFRGEDTVAKLKPQILGEKVLAEGNTAQRIILVQDAPAVNSQSRTGLKTVTTQGGRNIHGFRAFAGGVSWTGEGARDQGAYNQKDGDRFHGAMCCSPGAGRREEPGYAEGSRLLAGIASEMTLWMFANVTVPRRHQGTCSPSGGTSLDRSI